MPAANERALEKAKTIPADAIIFDLEDAVAPDAKDRRASRRAPRPRPGEYGRRELTIRCNGLDTAWGADDLAAIAASTAAAVVIPKVGSVAYVDDVSGRLDAAGAPAGDDGLGDDRDADGDLRRPGDRRPPARLRAGDGHQRSGPGAARAAGCPAATRSCPTWRRRCSRRARPAR